MPKSRLPEPVRVDLTNAAIGEGRCATAACFEEAFDEAKAYVNRLCDLKMSFDLASSSQVDLARLRNAIGRELILVIRDMDHLSSGIFQKISQVHGHPQVDLRLAEAGGAPLVPGQIGLTSMPRVKTDLYSLKPFGVRGDGIAGLGQFLPSIDLSGRQDAASC